MAKLNEQPIYEPGIYRLEKNDPVEGGPPQFDDQGDAIAGWDNAPNQQLANRTAFLKAAIDALGAVNKTSGPAFTGNMNSLRTAGWYAVANNATNKPASGNFVCLVAMGADEDSGAQHAFRLSDNTAYYRVRNGGSWADWIQVVTADQLGTAASRNVGTGADQIPLNSNLGSAAYSDSDDFALPAGMVAPFARRTGVNQIPDGWLPCNGSEISRATYERLFAVIGTLYGSGDGSTTFNLPDLRSEFIRGAGTFDLVSLKQTDQIRYHQHVVPWGEQKSDTGHAPFGHTPSRGKRGSGNTDGDNYWYYTNDGSNFEGPLNPLGVIGSETRPRNMQLLFLIKY